MSPYITQDTYKKVILKFSNAIGSIIKGNNEQYSDAAEMFEAYINDLISNAKRNYGVNVKYDKAFNRSPVDDLLKFTDEVLALLKFCMAYTPLNGVVVIQDLRACNLPEWEEMQFQNQSILTLKYNSKVNGKIYLMKPTKSLFNNQGDYIGEEKKPS